MTKIVASTGNTLSPTQVCCHSSAVRDLNELQVYIAVADRLSFDSAARHLGMSASTVSRRIAALERRLGVALLQRTTRSVRLTSAGLTYREHCAAVIDAAARADDALAQHRDELRGALCVNAPYLFGRHVLAPLAVEFAAAHPGLRVHVELTNSFVDPVKAGCDLVIRTGKLADSGLRARLIAQMATVIVASPECVATHGDPGTLEGLARLPCIVFGGARERRWRGSLPLGPLTTDARFTSNDLDVVREAALGGVGFALLPRFAIADLIESGRLVVLGASDPPFYTPLYAVFPAHAIPTPAAQALADFVRCRGIAAADRLDSDR